MFINSNYDALSSRSSAAGVFLENTKIKHRAQSRPMDLFRLSVSRKNCFRKSTALPKNASPTRDSDEAFLPTLYICGSEFFVEKRPWISPEGMTEPEFWFLLFKIYKKRLFWENFLIFHMDFLKMRIENRARSCNRDLFKVSFLRKIHFLKQIFRDT